MSILSQDPSAKTEKVKKLAIWGAWASALVGFAIFDINKHWPKDGQAQAQVCAAFARANPDQFPVLGQPASGKYHFVLRDGTECETSPIPQQ